MSLKGFFLRIIVFQLSLTLGLAFFFAVNSKRHSAPLPEKNDFRTSPVLDYKVYTTEVDWHRVEDWRPENKRNRAARILGSVSFAVFKEDSVFYFFDSCSVEKEIYSNPEGLTINQSAEKCIVYKGNWSQHTRNRIVTSAKYSSHLSLESCFTCQGSRSYIVFSDDTVEALNIVWNSGENDSKVKSTDLNSYDSLPNIIQVKTSSHAKYHGGNEKQKFVRVFENTDIDLQKIMEIDPVKSPSTH